MAKSSKKNKQAPLEPVIEYVLTFDGEDDWVELPPASIPSGNEITCSFWAYGGAALPKNNAVIAVNAVKDANNQRILTIHLPWANSWIYFDCTDPHVKKYDRLEKEIDAADFKGKWTHWAFTKNATTGAMKIYLNGELWHQETNKTNPIPPAAEAQLGCSFDSEFYPGRLAQVQLWNRERTQAEIQEDMPRRLRGDEPGLVSYWPLNEGEGTIAHDKTSNANHGTIHGNPTWEVSTLSLLDATPSPSEDKEASSSPIKSVLVFDRKDPLYIEVKEPFKNNREFTISLWLNTPNFDGWRGFIGKHGDQYRKPSLWTCPNNGLHYDSYSSTGERVSNVLEGFFTAPNSWTHIAWVKQGKEYKFYRNGELFTTQPAPEIFYTTNSSYFIGKVDNFFDGKLADVQIWNCARTQVEIQQDMPRRLRGDEPGLVSYWPLNEGEGAIAHDKTSNANHGTIHGNPIWEASTLSLLDATPSPSEDKEASSSPPSQVDEPVLVFDGEDDWVELPPASIPSGNEITCSFWAYGGAALPKNNSVIEVEDANKQRILNVHLPWNNSRIYFDCGNNAPNVNNYDRLEKEIDAADCKGKWTHWAFTKNATTGAMKIYLNGELWHQETNKTNPIPPAAKARLGCSLKSQFYPGRLAQVQLWNRELTQAEIQENMPRRLRGDEPGLVSYWPLNEGEGTIAHDKTSNANHGTIHGNPTWEVSTLSLLDATPSPSPVPDEQFIPSESSGGQSESATAPPNVAPSLSEEETSSPETPIPTKTWTKELVQEHAKAAVMVEVYTLPFYFTVLSSIKDKKHPAYCSILSICIEEMLHLQLAANLCIALDTQPIFTAPKYDGTPIPYLEPKNPTTGHHKLINVKLDSLNETTLDLMLDIETPSGLEEARHPEPGVRAKIHRVEDALEAKWNMEYHTTPQYPYNSIGEMYEALVTGIKVVGENQFSWKTTNQQSFWPKPGSQYVEPFKQIIASFEDAENAIKTISLQGEGTTSDEGSYAIPPNYRLGDDEFDSGSLSEHSHYERLLEIKNQQGTPDRKFPDVYTTTEGSPSKEQQDALQALELGFANLLTDLDTMWNKGKDPNGSEVNFWGDMYGLLPAAEACWKAGVVPNWSSSPNVVPSPSPVPDEQFIPVEESVGQSEPATAPPNVAPSPPEPAVESSTPLTPNPETIQPIPPVALQGRQMVLVLDDKHQGISAGRGALNLQGHFTIEAWVHPATDAGKQVIFAEGETLFYLEGGKLKFQTPLATEAIASTHTIVPKSWYHVAVVRAGSHPGATKLYINGVHNDNQIAIPAVVSSGNTYLGGHPNVPESRFQGRLLEVRVWRDARSLSEIEANRLYPMTGRELGLVRYWSLTQTVGSVLHDKTTNRAVGTLSGDAVWEEVEIPLKLKLDPQERLTSSTGLVDYGYWYKEMAKQQKTEADPPFLRGRIWA